jgi:hypothetical protein
MTQKVTCKKFRPSAMCSGRWVRDSQRFEETRVPPILTVKAKRPHSFSRFKGSKVHLLFKLKALHSLKRQKQLTRGYYVTFQQNGILIDRHERKNLRFFKRDVIRYRMLSTSYLSLRFNFYFEQIQSLNQHTIKATYTLVCIKSFHLISPIPSSPVLLIGEYREFYCQKKFLSTDILFHGTV